MAHIFLSYRRDDCAGFAGRLADALEAEFGLGSVFRDIDDIGPGEDFVHTIASHLQQVNAVVVMIGPRWLAAGADGQPRLNHPGDFVRQEIETALESGKPVIPLLVSGASMPGADSLPDAIAGLSRRQAMVLSDGNWRGDVERLVMSLRGLVPHEASATNRRRRTPVLAAAAVGLVVLALGINAWRQPPADTVAPAIHDITGRWTAQVKYDWGDQHDEVFEFEYRGDELAGTATYLRGRLSIEQAELKGDWLRFVTRSQQMLGSDMPWKEVTHRYTGEITPAGIRFTLESGGGYSVHPPITFTAQRAPAP